LHYFALSIEKIDRSSATLFAVAIAVIDYFVSFHDRLATQREGAWRTLREAIVWIEGDPLESRTGNVGQIEAIETLVHDCGHFWHKTFIAPIFTWAFPNCVDLKSLVIERMELGGLQAPAANFSYSDFNCSNLTTANFRNADLTGAW
jgi:hypothetical protein